MSPEAELLNTEQAAEYLKVSISWLNHDRANKPPKVPYVRVGQVMVRYRKTDLRAYVKKLNKA